MALLGDLTGVGTLGTAVNGIMGKFLPDKTEIEKTQIAGELSLALGQMQINQAEAANRTLFVSGWRPFVGWVCGLACAWNWVGLPMANFFQPFAVHWGWIDPSIPKLAGADLTQMLTVLMGMLGMAGWRTVEKINNVAAK